MGRTSLVVLDSNCLSYLLDGIYTITGPTGPVADQQIALVRIMLYDEWGLFVTPTVVDECERIRNNARAAVHDSWLSTLITEMQPINSLIVSSRGTQLLQWHNDPDDCRIVAECEDAGIRVVLTYDRPFIGHLRSRTVVKVLRPTEYWESLGIPKGSGPQTSPHDTNPLASLDWWRW